MTWRSYVNRATTKKDCTALHLATEDGRDDLVEVLLAHKANVDVVDKTNRNALVLAAQVCTVRP